MRGHISHGYIVAGLDGSRASLTAALWAVDEAVSRDVPLRLVTAIASPGTEAEAAVRHAEVAIAATGKPVKVEVDIEHGAPAGVLLRASRAAAMVCLGSVGLQHFQPGHTGSTAAAVAAAAECPVAIVRGERTAAAVPGWVLVEADASPDTPALLETAMAEARLRGAPLRVVTCWHAAAPNHGEDVSADHRRVTAALDRRVARWRWHDQGLEVETASYPGSLTDYLTECGSSVQLLVVSVHNRRDVRELLSPGGNAALHSTDCSLLIVRGRRL